MTTSVAGIGKPRRVTGCKAQVNLIQISGRGLPLPEILTKGFYNRKVWITMKGL